MKRGYKARMLESCKVGKSGREERRKAKG